MNVLATILAGLIVLSIPLLWWLRLKERERYSRNLKEIQELVNERSQSIDSLHDRFDQLQTKTEGADGPVNSRNYFYVAPQPPVTYHIVDLLCAYQGYSTSRERLRNLYPANSQDYWGLAVQKPGSNVADTAFCAGRYSNRAMKSAWSTFQSSVPRQIAHGRNTVRPQTPLGRSLCGPSVHSPYADAG